MNVVWMFLLPFCIQLTKQRTILPDFMTSGDNMGNSSLNWTSDLPSTDESTPTATVTEEATTEQAPRDTNKNSNATHSDEDESSGTTTVDACVGISCNHGFCLNIGNSTFVCVCEKNFIGDHCDQTDICETINGKRECHFKPSRSTNKYDGVERENGIIVLVVLLLFLAALVVVVAVVAFKIKVSSASVGPAPRVRFVTTPDIDSLDGTVQVRTIKL